MDGTARTLTLSLGRFSCAVEGFENAVPAMRALAAHLLDDAADSSLGDGPAPEALAEIAARALGAPVAARAEGGAIHLSPVPDTEAITEAEAAPPEAAAVAADQSEAEADAALLALIAGAARAVRPAPPEGDAPSGPEETEKAAEASGEAEPGPEDGAETAGPAPTFERRAVPRPPLPAPEAEPQGAGSAPDAALGRLLEATEARMDAPDTSRRRASLRHLRHAAATAPGEEGEGGRVAPRDRAYREDLARAIHGDGMAPGQRGPAAPLLLRPDQRVDLAQDADLPPLAAGAAASAAGALHPRRVRRGALALKIAALQQQRAAGWEFTGALLDEDEPPAAFSSLASSEAANAEAAEAEPNPPVPNAASPGGPGAAFAAFAARNRVDTIADAIEAAAVHLVRVMGLPDVGRPELMERVKALPQAAAWTRDERLASFATLLREGRLQRVGRARFAPAERSRFDPD